MLDERAATTTLSRGTRKQQRTIESAVHKLEVSGSRPPRRSQVGGDRARDNSR